MRREVFIVEDKEELINDLRPEFKDHNDIILKAMPSRYFSGSFVRYSFFDTC